MYSNNPTIKAPSNNIRNSDSDSYPLSGVGFSSSAVHAYSYHLSSGIDGSSRTSLPPPPPPLAARTPKTYSPVRQGRWAGGGGGGSGGGGGGGGEDDFRHRYRDGSLTRASTPGGRDSLQQHLDKFPIWKGLQHSASPEPGAPRKISMTGKCERLFF